MYNINGLQKICDILLENPSWTVAHLIANFNLAEHISHPKVLDLIDQEDYATKMTPFQVRIPFSNFRSIFSIITEEYNDCISMNYIPN